MADREFAQPALGARLQEAARRAGLSGFWGWWTHELAALMPSTPRAALARRRMRPVLQFEGDRATLWRPSLQGGDAVMVEAAHIPLVGDAASVASAGQAAFAPMAMNRMAYGGAIAPIRIAIALSPRDVLRKRIVLPSAIEENFRQALAYDLDRHTPFKPEELYFDAAIVGRDGARGTITVDLATARRAVVDPLLRHAVNWGAQVVAVVPEPPARAAASRLNLLPRDSRSTVSPWRRWQFWLPLGLFVAAALAATLIPVWQKRDYAIQLDTVVAQARGRASVSEALRGELDARVGEFNAALERKYAYPSALVVVDTVSKLLPDDTWLTQFELKTVAKGKEMQRELLVRGESANAGRLVQLFESSQLFAQATPRSPTTKIQPGPGEIFDLGAQLKPLPAPTAVSLFDAPPPSATATLPPGIAATQTPPGTPPVVMTPPPPVAPVAGGPPPVAPPVGTPVAASPPGAPVAASPPPGGPTRPAAAPKGASEPPLGALAPPPATAPSPPPARAATATSSQAGMAGTPSPLSPVVPLGAAGVPAPAAPPASAAPAPSASAADPPSRASRGTGSSPAVGGKP